jgi:hypothetical protein
MGNPNVPCTTHRRIPRARKREKKSRKNEIQILFAKFIIGTCGNQAQDTNREPEPN